MKTKAVVLYEINKSLRIEELEVPKLKPGQVLVKIAFSGICHSQLNEIKGKKGEDKFLPHTLGHEGSGIVEEIGSGVTKVKPGDKVVLSWIEGKGMNVASCQYFKNGGVINSGAISTFSQFSIISENRIVPIAQEMPLDKAALLGCAIPTGAGIIFNTINPSSENSIAVFGVGGVGMSSIIAAGSLSCRQIIAVDIHEKKLEMAIKLGATVAINASRVNPIKAIKDITNGRGVDYAIEAVGLKQTMEAAFISIRDEGGLLVIAGNLPYKEKISIDPFELIKGKRLIGTWGGQTDPDKDIPRYATLYLTDKLPLKELITHIYSLDDVNSAFTELENGTATRVLITNEIEKAIR